MDSAEVYMTLLRPSMVPVFGEAAPLEFTGQVELAAWTWNLKNEEETKRAEAAAQKYDDSRKFIESRGSANTRAQIQKLQYGTKMKSNAEAYKKKLASIEEEQKKQTQPMTRAQFDSLEKKRTDAFSEFEQQSRDDWSDNQRTMHNLFNREQLKAADREKARGTPEEKQISALEKQATAQDKAFQEEFNRGFEFTFSKRVDVATTQMLNSMKAGDVFPTAVLTIHQRSSNAGLSLIITVQKLRFLDYALKCEVSDTMTDMREEWKAEFYSLAYVYKNRKAINKSSGVGQTVAMAATQGTVRAFSMKNIGLPI